jgi:hypothetical protein
VKPGDPLVVKIDGVTAVLKLGETHVVFPRDAEAEVIADHLLTLPVETRRTLYLIIHENADAFNGVPFQKNTKTHPWPPKPRRPQ